MPSRKTPRQIPTLEKCRTARTAVKKGCSLFVLRFGPEEVPNHCIGILRSEPFFEYEKLEEGPCKLVGAEEPKRCFVFEQCILPVAPPKVAKDYQKLVEVPPDDEVYDIIYDKLEELSE